MDASASVETRQVQVATGIRTNYRRLGRGDPLLLIAGVSSSLGEWHSVVPGLAETFDVISFDNRGLGASERGAGAITARTMADDAAALLDALDVERAHVCGYSLGSAAAQELVLVHPRKVGALVLYGTWGRIDGFQTAVFTALSHPWESGDMNTAFTAFELAFSPEFINAPAFAKLMEEYRPQFPSMVTQIAATREQWAAAFAHDTLDRLPRISAPTLVIAGEQDLITPPWQCRAVAERIPGARYVCLTGPGSSHALAMERSEEFVTLVRGFLADHRL